MSEAKCGVIGAKGEAAPDFASLIRATIYDLCFSICPFRLPEGHGNFHPKLSYA